MTDARRHVLRRRYLSLGAGELAAAGVFAFVGVTTVLPRYSTGERVAVWSALAPLLVVLLQGGTYWLSARRRLDRPMPPGSARLYRSFRVADAVLLMVGAVGVIVWLPDRPGAALTVVALWLFALVEYLNYFVVRLAYPVGRWLPAVTRWSTPRLVRDLRRTERPRGTSGGRLFGTPGR